MIKRGKLSLASLIFDQTIESLLKVYTLNDIRLGRALEEMGFCLIENNLKEEGLCYIEISNDIYKSNMGGEHPFVANFNQRIAVKLAYLGLYETSLPFHDKALDLYTKMFGFSHPQVAHCYLFRTKTESQLGNEDRALEYHLKAFDIFKSKYGVNH